MMRLRSSVRLVAILVVAACTRPSEAGPVPAADAPAASPVAQAGSAFSLYDLGSTWVDQRGDTVHLERLAGKPRVVSLVYTSCHATCPAILVALKQIEAAVPADRRKDVGFVLISLDPARDTPGRLAAWAEGNALDPARWTLLNGSDGAVREIAATLGVRYQQLPDGEVAHANVITLLDATGAMSHQQTTLGEETRATAAALQRLLTR